MIIAITIFIMTGCTSFTTEPPETNDNNADAEEIQINIVEPSILQDSIKIAEEDIAPLLEQTTNTKIYNDYNISLEIDPITRYITGIEKLRYTNNQEVALNEIYFNLYLNAFSKKSNYTPYFENFQKKIFQAGIDYGYIDVKSATVNEEKSDFIIDGTAMKIELKEPLLPGQSVNVSLLFEAYIPSISHRTGSNAKVMWLGNFLPQVAVYDSQGWHLDEYAKAGDPFFSEISNYNVSITTPMEYKVVSTGIETELEKEERKVTIVNAQMVRDFAFVVSSAYNIETVTSDLGVDINFYYYSDIPDLAYYIDIAKGSLEYCIEEIGSYPYSSLDIVETELFFESGMEYPQIIFMDSDYLQNRNSAATIVHEVAHQWFYNIIGNDQINEAWIDEGFAALIQDMFMYNENDLKALMEDNYNKLSSRLTRLPITIPGQNLKEYESWNNYYNVEYLRSKLMLYQLREMMGVENFSLFLTSYYNKYSFKSASRLDVISTAEEIHGEELGDFFSAWLDYTKLPDFILN